MRLPKSNAFPPTCPDVVGLPNPSYNWLLSQLGKHTSPDEPTVCAGIDLCLPIYPSVTCLVTIGYQFWCSSSGALYHQHEYVYCRFTCKSPDIPTTSSEKALVDNTPVLSAKHRCTVLLHAKDGHMQPNCL